MVEEPEPGEDVRKLEGGTRRVNDLMKGKRGLIMGLANDRSLAWGIAQAAWRCRAPNWLSAIRVTRSKSGCGRWPSNWAATCWSIATSATWPRSTATFDELRKRWDGLDFIVHAIGFSDKNELRGGYVDTSLDNFLMTMNISVYSFFAVAQRARTMMKPGGSMLTLSYYGAEKVIPHYNVMGVAKAALETSVKYLAADLGPEGIRVNAISAGPIKTLAASGIGDFRYIMKWNEYNSPLRRNVTIEDVGGAGLYLLSDLASGVTGEIHHVDAGYNVVGMKAEDAPDIATV